MIRVAIGSLLIGVLIAGAADAVSPPVTILETAHPATEHDTGGPAILEGQFLAARFSVNEVTQITHIGGDLGSGPNVGSALFAAIVKLSGPNAMPVSGSWPNVQSAFNSQDIVGTTLFSAWPPDASHNVTLTFSHLIGPGSYALVFGTGMFGASGQGFMGENNPTIAGQASLMGWWATTQDPENGQFLYQWNEMPVNSTTMRFFVEGFAIPEPAAATLLVTGLGIAGLARRVRRRPRDDHHAIALSVATG